MFKRLFVLVLAVAALGLCFSARAAAAEKIKVGLLRFGDESGYPLSEKGVLAQLKTEGFDESNVDFDLRNANSEKIKTAEIIKEFVDKKKDLIIAIGTSVAIEAYKQTKDIPLLCVQVFDPVESGLAKSWENSGTNVTGTSSWVNLAVMMNVLKNVSPLKRVGVLYSQEERNSVIQLEGLKKIQKEMGFEVIAANVSKPEEAGEAARSLVGNVDSIFVTGATIVGKGLEVSGGIMEVVIKAKIPTITHSEFRAQKGVLLAVSPNTFKVGELAGKKGAQILRGTKPADIPIEPLKNYDIVINLKTAKKMGLDIPVSLLKIASKVIKDE